MWGEANQTKKTRGYSCLLTVSSKAAESLREKPSIVITPNFKARAQRFYPGRKESLKTMSSQISS